LEKISDRIPTRHSAPAKNDQIDKHVSGIMQKVDLGGGVIIPTHGHFHNLPSKVPDQEQDFGIKAKAVNALKLKGPPSGVSAEELQTTLGVMNFQAREQSYQQIKKPPGIFPPPRLADSDQRPVKRARTNRGIGRFGIQCGQEFVRFLNWRRKVRVCKENDLAVSFQNASSHTEPFSPVTLVVEHLRPGPCGLEFFEEFQRAVTRSVIHKDNLNLKGF